MHPGLVGHRNAFESYISARWRRCLRHSQGLRPRGEMKDPINLSIGLPDFDVPQQAKQAAIEAINSGQNRYTQTQGIAPLRERLRADLSKEIGRDVGEVLITSGVSGALFLAILATIDPGDEAIFLDPYFVMYKHLLTMAGGRANIVDSYRFSVSPIAFARPSRRKPSC
jgi:aspartate/methionine/tyrosine aminotransferase